MPQPYVKKVLPSPAAASTTLNYRFVEGAVPFIGQLFTETVQADTANYWLETFIRTRTIFGLTILAGATFSGRFQGTLDEQTWFDLVPEAGSTTVANPITQASVPGFWIFTGVWKYMRFNPTALAVGSLVANFSTVRL